MPAPAFLLALLFFLSLVMAAHVPSTVFNNAAFAHALPSLLSQSFHPCCIFRKIRATAQCLFRSEMLDRPCARESVSALAMKLEKERRRPKLGPDLLQARVDSVGLHRRRACSP